MMQFATALAYQFAQRSQVHGPIVGDQVVYIMLTASGYKLNALVPLTCVYPCSPFLRSFDRQGFF